MEVIKKKILQVLTTGLTATTGGSKYVIIPDLSVTYYLKIGLFSKNNDIGFFDANTVVDAGTSRAVHYDNITGSTTTSRLGTLEKYTITNIFTEKYVTGGTINIDGVDTLNSNPLTHITYYIKGIKYIDVISATTSGVTSGTTYIIYAPLGTGNTLNFNGGNYYKNPNKENIISNPKIDDDVFISRQEVSAFNKNYMLEYVKNLNDLKTYAGGNFFKIKNNT